METSIKFEAPWSASLKWMTLLCVVILLGVALAGIWFDIGGGAVWLFSMVITPVLTLVVAAFFIIRGYTLTDHKLLVQRLGWQSEVALADLQSAEVDAEAMNKSIRTFGNYGLFCIAGKYWNKKLGSYRAFATDPRLAVTMRFSHKVVVVTPGDPEGFVEQLRQGIRSGQAE